MCVGVCVYLHSYSDKIFSQHYNNNNNNKNDKKSIYNIHGSKTHTYIWKPYIEDINVNF